MERGCWEEGKGKEGGGLLLWTKTRIWDILYQKSKRC